ncbi:MAG TPA: zinc ribbon domain-containing protein [Pseudomonadota bacterium]|nr:zinc ribbon domain-containing protein [Pseudomonadota bacterium]
MRWECHECGEVHAEIPEQCRACGTKPEIVRNVWRCPSCGEQGIDGTRTGCPACGAEKGKDAQQAVAGDQRIEGEQGRALASGPWLYCAFCKTQVPPVYVSGPKQGQPTDRCPTCSGPLSESKIEAASEVVRASEAAQYRAARTQARGGGDAVAEPQLPAQAPATPSSEASAPPTARRRVWPWVLLTLFLGLIWLFASPGRKVRYVVERRDWERTIAIETLQKRAGRDFESDLPKGAYNTACERKFRKNRDVPIGTEIYFEDEEDRSHCEAYETRTVQEEVEDGKRCTEQGYKTQGGVSVKTCLSWEPKYKTVSKTERECARYRVRQVKKTRTKYKQEPVYENHCSYEVDTVYRESRVLRAGSDHDGDTPRWPEVSGLSSRDRTGSKKEKYTLHLKKSGGNEREDYAPSDEAEWARHAVGSVVTARVKLGVVVGLIEE